MEIKVRYVSSPDETAIFKSPFTEVDALTKTGVLFISLSNEWGNREALVTRFWSRHNRDPYPWAGDDNYAIGVIGDKFFTAQWADTDASLFTRRVSDGSLTETIARPPMFPSEAKMFIFKGGYIPPTEWKAALAAFEFEMF